MMEDRASASASDDAPPDSRDSASASDDAPPDSREFAPGETPSTGQAVAVFWKRQRSWYLGRVHAVAQLIGRCGRSGYELHVK